jgi:hypothetical protein
MRLSSASREINGKAFESYSLRLEAPGAERADIIVSRGGPTKVRKIAIDCERTRFEFDDAKPSTKLISIERDSGISHTMSYDTAIEPLRAELLSFLDCVQSQRQSALSSFSDGLHVVSMLETAERYACSTNSRPPVVSAL